MAQLVRLNKFLSESGVCSRRGADALILRGEVKINGHLVKELGVKVTPGKDVVMVSGKKVIPTVDKHYLMFHKPGGVLCTVDDPEGRPTVMEYFKEMSERIFPVGRLDWSTEGLLLMTNDGEFANRILHPKHEISKTYMVKVDGQPRPEELKKLLLGVSIPGGRVSALDIENIKSRGSNKYDWIRIVITGGKNHQVKHMFAKIGYDVIKLQRVAIGGLTLGRLERGEWAPLSQLQIEKIFMPYKDPNRVRKKTLQRQKSTKRISTR